MKTLYVRPDGRIVFVYSDALAGLSALGKATTVRASTVEPGADGRGWVADLAPAGGPALKATPLRTQALAAEAAWLEERLRRGPLDVGGKHC